MPVGGATVAGYHLAAGVRIRPSSVTKWHFTDGGPLQTTVSSAIGLITHDPALFSEPNSFVPERWLGDDSKDLEKWFLVFSRGSRGCLGQKLVSWMFLIVFHSLTVHSVAYLELYVVLANLFRRFNMSLYKTDKTTVQWKESAAARLCNHVKVTVDSVRR